MELERKEKLRNALSSTVLMCPMEVGALCALWPCHSHTLQEKL